MTHVQDHCCIIKKKKKKVSQRHSDTGPHFFAHEPDYSSSASDITSYFNQRRSWPKRWSGGPLPFCHQIEITKGLAGRQTTLKNLLPGHLISLADQKLFTPDAWITTKKNPQTAAPHFECRLCTLSRTCWCENKLNMAPDLSVITRGVFQSLKKPSRLSSPGRESTPPVGWEWSSGGKVEQSWCGMCSPPKKKK